MPSEYDPLFAERRSAEDDLTPVVELFRAASGPYLRSYWSWLTWAVVLPAAALLTSPALRRGAAAVLFTWSAAILIGGAVEIVAIRRGGGPGRGGAAGSSIRSRAGRTPLASWALRAQGNLSLVAVVLSLALLWQDLAWMLPGLWLLLLGHSFYTLGGIAFPPFRLYGHAYQLGGLAALWPGGAPLPVFALTAAAANLWMAYAVWRDGRG
ncbi:MAG TPA: hypothetical protein VHQ90_07645 [Thermoanaerobaculia bacterium]|nr:hypothetical protein [Thermoanaerobaculia bacterium]